MGFGIWDMLHHIHIYIYIRLPACLLVIANYFAVVAAAARAEIINIAVICCAHRCINTIYIRVYLSIHMQQTALNFLNVYYNK